MTLMGDEPELGLGDSGEHVVALQDRLRGLGLLTEQPHGSYDDATERAVRELQSTIAHDTDGRVTPDTWQALDQHMLSNGLQYSHYAGAGNQHWDQERADGGWDQGGADGYAHTGQDADSQAHGQEAWGQAEAGHYGSGEQHADQDAASDAHAGEAQAGEVTIGSLSPDGWWKWNGAEWEAADAAEPAPAGEPETPVIPHIDNIHPAVAGDERFSSFHDFLRDNAPAQ